MFQDGDIDKFYTHSGVKEMSQAFGAGLKSTFNWQKGDILTLFASNSIDIPVVMLGTLLAGGTFSPANPAYTATELANQLMDSQPKAIAIQYRSLTVVKEAAQQAGIPRLPILLIGAERDPSSQIVHFTELRTLSSGPTPNTSTPTKIKPKTDIAFLVYSSGTTGKPKGVQLSHYNVTSNISQLQPGDQEYLTWDGSKTCRDIPLPKTGLGGDKVLVCVPMYHILGLTKAIINPLYRGVTAMVMERFEIKLWCALVQRHAITFSYIVPPIVLLLCKDKAVLSYDLSSIRMANSGAAPLSKELIDACHRRTGIRIKQGYGMTETCPTVFNQTWDDWDRPVGSTGQLLPNVEAKICQPFEECASTLGEKQTTVQSESEGLELGQVGELYVRGPNVFLGYHNNVAATRDCLSPSGWYRTGDVGYIDPRGNLFITDRVKELIKYKGNSVAPVELEGFLLDHPLVDDCAVVGVQSAALGTEVPTAYVVLKASHTTKESQELANKIRQWFDGRVVNYKKLRGGVKFVGAIPKSASGKILRRVMKQWVRAEEGKTQDGAASSLFAKL